MAQLVVDVPNFKIWIIFIFQAILNKLQASFFGINAFCFGKNSVNEYMAYIPLLRSIGSTKWFRSSKKDL